MAKQPCGKCSAPIDVIQPKIEIINGESVSMVIINSSGYAPICVNCGTQYMFAISQVQLAGLGIVLAPLPVKEEQSRIILPN
jgi:hypothetical protein